MRADVSMSTHRQGAFLILETVAHACRSAVVKVQCRSSVEMLWRLYFGYLTGVCAPVKSLCMCVASSSARSCNMRTLAGREGFCNG